MATDYDAPRNTTDETESIEVIKESAAAAPSVSDVDLEDADGVAGFSIPEAVAEDLDVVVLPPQSDEFTCMECFIVKHHSQLSSKKNVCIECA